jgi:glycosyltransferase involved in cell wall biosynthesis
MRIASIAAGAGGMYCGSCLRDNTLAAELIRLGHDCLLVPTYTPLKTDEPGVAVDRVMFGGLNVYLQQVHPSFGRLPDWFKENVLDAPWLLNWLMRFSDMTSPSDLGAMTVSVLEGQTGRQRAEMTKLIRWLARDVRPDIVNLPNAMFVGMAGPIKAALRVPVVVTVSGEDLFLDGLPDRHRDRALKLIARGMADCDAVIATSRYYADHTSRLFRVPRAKVHVVPLGIRLDGHGGPRPDHQRPPTVGYLARLCPAKGLHVLLDALPHLRSLPGTASARIKVAGYLGEGDKPYVEKEKARLAERGLSEAVVWVGEVDRRAKVEFLQTVDVFSVPTVYRESKGLPVIEALANGTPAVQPAHGAWVEMLESTGGGLLVKPGDPTELALGLHKLLTDPAAARRHGDAGRAAVHERHTSRRMAEETLAIYRTVLPPK